MKKNNLSGESSDYSMDKYKELKQVKRGTLTKAVTVEQKQANFLVKALSKYIEKSPEICDKQNSGKMMKSSKFDQSDLKLQIGEFEDLVQILLDSNQAGAEASQVDQATLASLNDLNNFLKAVNIHRDALRIEEDRSQELGTQRQQDRSAKKGVDLERLAKNICDAIIKDNSLGQEDFNQYFKKIVKSLILKFLEC